MLTLRSNQGFSLVQVLLMSAALSASALVAIQSFKHQKEDLKEAEVVDKVEQVHNMIYAILQNRNHCLKTLVGSHGTLINPEDVRPIDKILMADSVEPAFVVGANNRYLTGSVSLENLQLVFPSDLTDLATLNIEYARHGNKRVSGDTIRRSIKIAITRSDANHLSSCTSVTVNDGTVLGEKGNEHVSREICESFQLMQWDPILRKCSLRENVCPPQTIFAGLDNNGQKICRTLHSYLKFLIAPTNVQSCPDHFDQVKLNRSQGKPYLVSIECNKKNSTCPSNHRITWEENGLTCEGYLPRGNDGDTTVVSDNDALPMTSAGGRATGSATYECDQGTWKLKASTVSCIAPCLSTSKSWRETSSGDYCVETVPDGHHNDVVDVEDIGLPTLGKAKYKCVDRSWVEQSRICVSPCTSKRVTWGACEAMAPDLNDGENATVADTVAPSTGSAKVVCNNGAYAVTNLGCVTPPQPGTCSWTRIIYWQNSNCTGFQVNETENVTNEFIDVNNIADCNALCNGCKAGAKSYEGCTFTPK